MVRAQPTPVHEHRISVTIGKLNFLSQDKLFVPAFVPCISYLASRLAQEFCSARVIWKWETRKLELSQVGQASTLLKCDKEEHQRRMPQNGLSE